MSHTEPLAVVEERDHHNAPTRTRVVDVDPSQITEVAGLIIDNRHLVLVEPCRPVCHATLILTLDTGATIDDSAGDHPDPDQAASEINRLSQWLTGELIEREPADTSGSGVI
ncbi:hypothetical protein CBF90_02025 [Microbacterium sp. AISO3]|uniref:hypothetical protein n=1 Tax=Microbacterium sp. AISO3 TaxID=2002831 RepID=UPI000B4C7595|nr:hypothetical protein [Microbacterium sp. AISO3]OWP20320.1 hypothetical protein CBF90_17220 [Microbacterium sp. AISO3]OWP23527.1 hypothetical protein CBF90_02025 [Microbacterium sp. AISO3]